VAFKRDAIIKRSKCGYALCSSEVYKRIAKPRNTLPKRTAMLVAAPGTKVPVAAPVEPPLEAVLVEPGKPVTAGLLVVEPVGACVDDIVLEIELLPR
jgi:hypothetical protein